MKTTLVLFAVGVLGFVLSQEQVGHAQPGKGIDLNAKVISANNKTSPYLNLTPTVQSLDHSVTELQETVASLKKEVAVLKASLARTNTALAMVKSTLAVPAGYTSQWVSKAYADRPGHELMRFHVQVVTPGAPGSK